MPPKSACIPSQCLWVSANDWLKYRRDFSQRKESCEPKEQILTSRRRDLRNTEREDFRGAMWEYILPDLSTMNTVTTSGIALFERLNLGMRVTMRAFELGMAGCTSSSAAGEERLAHLTRGMKSLPSLVEVWPSVASVCCGLKASSGCRWCPPRLVGTVAREGVRHIQSKWLSGHTCAMLTCTEIFTFFAVLMLRAPPALSALGTSVQSW